MLTYGNVPLSITLQRKDKPPYTVEVMPQMNAPLHADVDFAAEVMKEERQHVKEEKLWEFGRKYLFRKYLILCSPPILIWIRRLRHHC